MSERLLHLVRHGEVHNPDGVLYGRLPGFRLSDLGERMAEAAAAKLREDNREVTRLIASPLERAQQSAAPIAQAYGLEIATDERIIEPTNAFEGKVGRKAFKHPSNWRFYVNPLRPSWGEAYRSIADRVLAAMNDAFDGTPEGDVALVSHQAVIWAAHRTVAGKPLFHNPAKRRCDLSSITSFARRDGAWVEVLYCSPAAGLLAGSVDVGAV